MISENSNRSCKWFWLQSQSDTGYAYCTFTRCTIDSINKKAFVEVVRPQKKWLDAIDVSESSRYLVLRDCVINEFIKQSVKGYSFYGLYDNKTKKEIMSYYLVVPEVGVKLDIHKSCRYDASFDRHVFFDDSWNGYDIFTSDNGSIFCTMKIVELARANKWKGFCFSPTGIRRVYVYDGFKIDYLGKRWPSDFYPKITSYDYPIGYWVDKWFGFINALHHTHDGQLVEDRFNKKELNNALDDRCSEALPLALNRFFHGNDDEKLFAAELSWMLMAKMRIKNTNDYIVIYEYLKSKNKVT